MTMSLSSRWRPAVISLMSLMPLWGAHAEETHCAMPGMHYIGVSCETGKAAKIEMLECVPKNGAFQLRTWHYSPEQMRTVRGRYHSLTQRYPNSAFQGFNLREATKALDAFEELCVDPDDAPPPTDTMLLGHVRGSPGAALT